ncbi:MAG: FHA domain-containing protein [Clostridiales Family XIII bacterium]|jgi:hypothetical protein|nr:FHA domain-containing protein [Clostridiales Family XIII bacterium]
MNLLRCENGHFYDGDQFAQCPHCGNQGRNDDLTVGLTQGTIGQMDQNLDQNTEALTPQYETNTLAAAVQQATGGSVDFGNDSATVGYYDQALGSEPVVGWLVCIEGNHLGSDYRLKSGRNFIGRASSMDVAITGDDTVSREKHAIVVYEPKSHIFMIQPGESKELSYVNDKVVLAAEKLETNDIITLGATKLMFFPCCGEQFNWEMLQRV